MKIERTRNATRNIIFGVIIQIYKILVPFIMRTVMINYMGIQYLGINSLFASILQVLNLAELGVGSAMVYSMYRPIVEDDTCKICALLRLYRTYYWMIGAFIATIGLAMTPLIPRLIKDTLPYGLNVYILYIMHLFATVLSYWLFAYKNALFQAHQRIDITSKIDIISVTIQYIVQLFVIIYLKNYYFYVLMSLLTQAIRNIITAFASTKIYSIYQPRGKLNRMEMKEINRRIRDLFTSKISGVILNVADTVVISAFLGLTTLAIYQNYYLVINSIIGLVYIVLNACIAGIGNSIIIETQEKNYNDLKKFTLLMNWMLGVMTCCLLCVFQPFMEIWVGKNLMLSFFAVALFCVYFYVYEIYQLLITYKDSAGIWHADRFRPLITSCVNLCTNLLLVKSFGVYGVIISTILSLVLVGMPWLIRNLFTHLFDKKQMSTYVKILGKNAIVILFSCVVCYYLCSFVNFSKLTNLLIRMIICCTLPNIIYFIVYHKMPEFYQCVQLIDVMTKNKLNLKKRLR